MRSTKGYAMVVVLVFIATSFLTLSAAYRDMHQLFAFEESSDRLPSNSDGIQEALGVGLAKLQAGEPTVDGGNRYRCDLKLRESDGRLVKYRLTYRKRGNNRWWLRATPATQAQPDCPVVFADNACPAPR
ncbi:MAG: hypothetical protein V3R77_07510 [Candidatus Binatia bacterium]